MLELLFLRSSSRHYLREIAQLTDQNVRAIQRELRRLEEAGLVVSTLEGNRKYYQANRASAIFKELRSILIKTSGAVDQLRTVLQQHPGSIQIALIFGSFAEGRDSLESDIDLLIIGTISGRELSRRLSPLKDELEREINPIVMDADEFQGRLRREDLFVSALIDGPKIFIVGDQHDLEAMAGRGAP